ncbi:MAG: cyclase family protein [Steroidobacteraceae bacterium]
MTAPAFASQLRFDAATALARELDFHGPQPAFFGAPRATSAPLVVGDFTGDIAHGASCNCHRISLVPHCNGTHTESVAHLTDATTPVHRLLPLAPLPALLLTVDLSEAIAAGESSDPAPQQGDLLVTAAALRHARPATLPFAPRALLLRTRGTHGNEDNPPYLSREAATQIVAWGIEHLVVDLPSVDRSRDQGRLTAHRVFFGLPPGSRRAADAMRGHCTITELAEFPATVVDGPCGLLLQLPAFSGDAVPSRPIHLPLAAA